MPHPRLRHALTLTAVATLSSVAATAGLYHLGRCDARRTVGDKGRCIDAREHLSDHRDRAGHKWVDRRLLNRRAVQGVMFTAGATPASTPGVRVVPVPVDFLRRLGFGPPA